MKTAAELWEAINDLSYREMIIFAHRISGSFVDNPDLDFLDGDALAANLHSIAEFEVDEAEINVVDKCPNLGSPYLPPTKKG
jgi:hypothetical protein